MKTIEFTVQDSAGLHARPASILTKAAAKYTSDIAVHSNGKEGNLKSILSVMALGIKAGQSVTISIVGSDELAAYEELKQLVF